MSGLLGVGASEVEVGLVDKHLLRVAPAHPPAPPRSLRFVSLVAQKCFDVHDGLKVYHHRRPVFCCLRSRM